MKDGIGPDMTREDHAHIASQLFAAYAKVKDVRALASDAPRLRMYYDRAVARCWAAP